MNSKELPSFLKKTQDENNAIYISPKICPIKIINEDNGQKYLLKCTKRGGVILNKAP